MVFREFINPPPKKIAENFRCRKTLHFRYLKNMGFCCPKKKGRDVFRFNGLRCCIFFVLCSCWRLGLAPSQDASHHQDYDSFRPGDSYRPLFATVTVRGAVSKFKVANFGIFEWVFLQYLLSQWLTFWTFGDSIFSRENKVQTFFSGSIG